MKKASLRAAKIWRYFGLLLILFGAAAFFTPDGFNSERPSLFQKIMLSIAGGQFAGAYRLEEMTELCDQYGPPVHNGFAYADGYAFSPLEFKKTMKNFELTPEMMSGSGGGCFPCIRELVDYGYGFIEAFHISQKDRVRLEALSKFRRPWDLDHSDGYVRDTGWFRYRLVERSENSSQCQEYDYVANKSRIKNTMPSSNKFEDGGRMGTIRFRDLKKLEDQKSCIHIEKIQAPTARYVLEEYGVWHKEIVSWTGNGVIIRRTRNITDRTTGQQLASKNSFSYYHKDYATRSRSGDSFANLRYISISGCGGRGNVPSIKKVIRPMR